MNTENQTFWMIVVYLCCQADASAQANSPIAMLTEQIDDLNQENGDLRTQLDESRQMTQRMIEETIVDISKSHDRIAELQNLVNWQQVHIWEIEIENAMVKRQRDETEQRSTADLNGLRSEIEIMRKTEIERRNDDDSVDGIGATEDVQCAASTPVSVAGARMTLPKPCVARPGNVFQAVITMLHGVRSENRFFLNMIRDVTKCANSVHSGNSVERHQDLQDKCDNMYGFFGFNDHGHLSKINLRRCQMIGIVDLTAIPPTVRTVILAGNQLHGLLDLRDLKGTSLRHLAIEGNSRLRVNLRVLEDKANPIELEALIVSHQQICDYLQIDASDHDARRNQRIEDWNQKSTLKKLSVAQQIRNSRRSYQIFRKDYRRE